MRCSLAVLLASSVAISLVIPAPIAHADDIDDLKLQVATLTIAVRVLQNRATTLEAANEALKTRTTTVEASLAASTLKLARFRVSDDGRDIFVEGANLHLRSGSGTTAGAVNGYGNLIVGYNEAASAYDFYDAAGTGVERSGGSQRLGSHNLVVGDGHSYTSYGGAVFGRNNRITAAYATVAGGKGSIAGGQASYVAAGTYNLARGVSSTVLGGQGNTARGPDAAVVGGWANRASGEASTVLGGENNQARGDVTSVMSGNSNTAEAYESSVVGGVGNAIRNNGTWSVILGGHENDSNFPSSVVVGGFRRSSSAIDGITP
jgi:trimeric autotransporter adhesin